jgi:hypothetical protein
VLSVEGKSRPLFTGPSRPIRPHQPHQRQTDIACFSSIFGFLFGSTLAGAATYYYILEEYKVSNELLTEDIYVRLCI